MSNGIPIELLYELEGEIIQLETVLGTVYKGRLFKGDYTCYCIMSEVVATLLDGSVKNYQYIVIKGSKIRCVGLAVEDKNEASVAENGGEEVRSHVSLALD